MNDVVYVWLDHYYIVLHRIISSVKNDETQKVKYCD